ncbi:hypothetical protein [Streptomyces sp. NPDC048248]|uniref:hypothetical protein n=1 Tax=Streptomyces sp. NPDC048248 TaxID=3365523 RepID=UPI00371795FE
MDQGAAAVLAAGVAGITGAVGAAVGAAIAGRATRNQVVKEYAVQRAARLEEQIRVACDTFHERGMAALQAARALEEAICSAHNDVTQEQSFAEAISAALAATSAVRWCRPELERPAREWCVAIKLAADAARALRGAPEAARNPRSALNLQRTAAWQREDRALQTFWQQVNDAKAKCLSEATET